MDVMKEFARTAVSMAINPNELLKILKEELSMPNLKMKVADEEVFWIVLAEYNGWKLEQNTVFKQARILDSEGYRIAWGTVDGMEKALDRMIRYLEKYNKKA